MLNCRWSLENERSSECWGGVSADPVVSAVLKALGLSYVVEQGQSDDGLTWWRKWSNGWCEQGGVVLNSSHDTTVTVTLPIAFSSTNYIIDATAQTPSAWQYCFIRDEGKTVSSFKITLGRSQTTETAYGFNWKAFGFIV